VLDGEESVAKSQFLFEHLGDEASQYIIFDCVADLDGIAADFTIFDIDLAGNGEV
jgi:hypothetical protein